jgi:hypothetical protein
MKDAFTAAFSAAKNDAATVTVTLGGETVNRLISLYGRSAQGAKVSRCGADVFATKTSLM